MKDKFLFFAFVLAAVSANASPTLGTGTPGNAYLATPTGPSPSFGTLFNFDGLTSNSAFDPTQYSAQGVNISSPEGLVVYPYSTQSGPNELFDNSALGSANISIKTFGTSQLGIGIADSDLTGGGDPVTVYLQALDASGTAFGTLFSINLPAGGSNPGNGYFTLSDTSNDIFGIQITQPTGNANYSGLAIDDLQVAAVPEPTTLALLGAGAFLAGAIRLRKRS